MRIPPPRPEPDPLASNLDDWEAPIETAFDNDRPIFSRPPIVLPSEPKHGQPKSRMERFAVDIVPLAFASGVAAVLFAAFLGVATKVFFWIVG